VFTNWGFGEFNPDNLQTSFGQDYGYSIDPTTLTEVAIDKVKRKIYVKECFYKTKLTTSEIFTLNRTYAQRKLIIGDNAEARLIDELRSMGNNITRCDKPPIEFGISLMQDYEIVVDPNSQNIAKELNNYVYLDKGSKLYLDAYNHAIDSIRYNIVYNLGRIGGIDIR
jgi:phage terminase large subunit